MTKKRRKQVLYMAVELDEFELCIAYFDDLKSLSEWAGIPVKKLRGYLKYNFVDFKNKVRYIKIIF